MLVLMSKKEHNCLNMDVFYFVKQISCTYFLYNSTNFGCFEIASNNIYAACLIRGFKRNFHKNFVYFFVNKYYEPKYLIILTVL